MYCKNCGGELPGNAEICLKCGFRKNVGEGFCPNCGNEVKKMQSLCLNCGFILDEELRPPKEDESKISERKDTEKNDSKEYLKYVDRIKKISIFKISIAAISILMMLTMMFLPIYTCKIDANDIEISDIKDIEELSEIMKNGYIEKNFSIFDDIMLALEPMFDEVNEPSEYYYMTLIYSLLFPLFEVIFIAIFCATSIPQMIENYRNYSDPQQAAMLKYNEIKKTGIVTHKEKAWKRNLVLSIVLYAVFDVIFSKTLSSTIGSLIGSNLRYMDSFSGFSPLVIITLVFAVAYFVTKYMASKQEKEMLVSITQEEYK